MAQIVVVALSGNADPGGADAGLHVARLRHDARQKIGVDAVEVFRYTQGLRLVGEWDSDAGFTRDRADPGNGRGPCHRSSVRAGGPA